MRAFPLVSADESLLVAAARQAFFKMDVAQLRKLSRELGAAAPPGKRLLPVLLALVKWVLGCSDVEALEICKQRITAITTEASATGGEVTAMEEGLSFLQRDEREAFAREKKKSSEDDDELYDFERDFAMETHRLRQMPRIAKSATIPVPPGNISQPDMKKLLPPGASSWRTPSVPGGGWAGHMPPYARVSSRVDVTGSDRKSALEVLRLLWTQFLRLYQKPRADCPLNGLFESGGGAAFSKVAATAAASAAPGATASSGASSSSASAPVSAGSSAVPAVPAPPPSVPKHASAGPPPMKKAKKGK